MKKLILYFVLLVVVASCSALRSEAGISTPLVITAEVSTVLPDLGGTGLPVFTPEPMLFVPTELKYGLLKEFPDFLFCDPDYYPIAQEDELVLARQRFPELQANEEEFQTILAHHGLSGVASFSDDQKLLIYREHKKLNAIHFQMAGERYQFQIQTGSEGQQGTVITGTMDRNGAIDVLQREPGFPSCPICLAAGTLIDTPRGSVPVQHLKVGDPVWTANEAGERVRAVILEVGSVRVPASHQMIHVVLHDGRELWASAGHPTTNGRRLADLQLGDLLDGAQIVKLEQEVYNDVYTFDILPSGTTGFYWANSILIASTLQH
jgi:hypothetical protein